MKGSKNHRRHLAAGAAALGLAAAVAGSASAVPTPTTIPIAGSADSRPEGITLGPDGAIWYTDFGGHSIWKTVGGPGVRFGVPNDGPPDPMIPGSGAGLDVSGPAHIAAGSDGNLWFTAFNGTIGRVSVGGAITAIQATGATVNANLRGIASGPDGKLWFLEAEGDELRSINPAGLAQTTEDVSALGAPEAITNGGAGDANVYFTTTSGNIVKKNTAGGPAAPVGAVGGPANGITLGPDGNLWVTSGGAGAGGQVSKVSKTTGVLQSFPVGAVPKGITAGPDGALWFTEAGSNSVGRVTTAGAVTSIPLSGCLAPEDITTAADGALWVTCFGNNALVRIVDSATAPPGPGTGPGTGAGGTTPVANLKGGFSFRKGKVFAGKAFTVNVTFNKAVTKSRVRVQIRSANTKARGAIKTFRTVSSKLVTGKKAALTAKIAKPGVFLLRINYLNGSKLVNVKAVKVTVKRQVRTR